MSKKTLADLAAAHDKNVVVPARIRAALEALKKSGENWAYEIDFMAMIKPKISTIDIAKFRPQFSDFWDEVNDMKGNGSTRRVWFATAALCKQWKERPNA